VERGAMRVKCLAQEHNTMSWPGLEPCVLALELSILTLRPVLAIAMLVKSKEVLRVCT